jgi:hypothetical protein
VFFDAFFEELPPKLPPLFFKVAIGDFSNGHWNDGRGIDVVFSYAVVFMKFYQGAFYFTHYFYANVCHHQSYK